MSFTYQPGSEALPPVQFGQKEKVSISDKIARIIYCFGKVYVSSAYDGEILVFTIAEDYTMESVSTIDTVV